MKINLRKAHAIQQQIREELKLLDLSTGVVLNEYDGVKKQIESAHKTLIERLETYDKLSGVLLGIRKQVDQANADNGISDLLADAAALDKRNKVYSSIANSEVKKPLTLLEGRLTKLRDADGDASYFNMRDVLFTGVLSQDQIDEFCHIRAHLRQVKQDTQDMILKKNVETEITLDEMSVKILSDFGIM